MLHSSIRRLAALGLVLIAGTALASPAFAGPPWISAEFPSNPHDNSTRGAFFLVHTYHHFTPTQFNLGGTAEGIVNGRRQTLKLEIVATSKPGVYAVRYQPSKEGVWVLAINFGDKDGAGLLATIGRNGQVSSVQVPNTTAEGGRWIIPRRITTQDIESALRTQTALLDGANVDLGSSTVPALLVAGLGLVFGLPLARRFRNAR